MTFSKGWFFFFIILLWLGAARPALADDPKAASKAPAAALESERVITVPGDPDRPVDLQMTIYTPKGPGPFSLAVMNHGATGNTAPSDQPRYYLTFSAYYFLSRGYAVALPMMRGYAGSGGHLLQHGCDDVAIGLDAARDIRAVIDYLKQQPNIDGSRIVVAGQSFGGWNTLALGTLNVPGVKALVSFAGGMRANDCADQDTALSDAAARLGARTATPSIWFFGDNDAVFPTPVWRAMYEHYVAAGGPATLVAYGQFGADSHNLLGSAAALHLWVPELDAFLAKVGLPHTQVSPEYMPTPAPAPSHYAALDDMQALPYLTEHDYAYYRAFLNMPSPRAFAIGPHGAASSSEGFDAQLEALKLCGKASSDCRLYAVDNDVVWTRPSSVPVATRFAQLGDVSAVPYLNAQGREGYRNFLKMRRPRAFSISSNGAWEAVSLGIDPAAEAQEACNRLFHHCRLYAVDGDVVWPESASRK
ncbi:CocE/NonD family hydrolase [Burkholderia sp. 9120]|uniref:alpha/beta hydrolase family protein n=1 Tax=Burkholderia sp. 9120 TaxID=1500897 RepID=UPI00068D0597|nr:CocE/NonD family hydrolase [Burkholderia sp. 9120]